MIELPKLENCPFYQFNTQEIRDHFKKKNLMYLNTFVINSYMPYAVYGLPEPDKKGLKYLIVQQKKGDLKDAKTAWMTEEGMKPWRKQEGIRCKKCGDVIYSRYVHDMHSCKCEAVYIDGGKEYLRISGTEWEHVAIDLIDNTYKVWVEPEPEFKDYLVTFTAYHTCKVKASSIKDAQDQVEKYDLVNILNDYPTETEVKVTKICLADE